MGEEMKTVTLRLPDGKVIAQFNRSGDFDFQGLTITASTPPGIVTIVDAVWIEYPATGRQNG